MTLLELNEQLTAGDITQKKYDEEVAKLPKQTAPVLSGLRKQQAEDQKVKASSGVTSDKDATDAEADLAVTKGAELESSYRKQVGVMKTVRISGWYGESLPEFKPSKASGKMTRSVGLFLNIDGVTSLHFIPEMADKPLNITVGQFITLPFAQVPVGAIVVRLKAEEGAVITTYAKGGWIVAGENAGFGAVASEAELFMLAKTVSMATSTKVLEKAGR